MLTWKNFSRTIDSACRIEVLKREYAHKFYLNQLFQALRQELVVERRARLVTLGHVVKAWRDHLAYKRHLMQCNLSISLHY